MRFIIIIIISFMCQLSFPQTEKVYEREHKLKWEDFKSNVPPEIGDTVAVIANTIFVEYIEERLEYIEVRVMAIMKRDESWVLPSFKNQVILNHEQGHFDICEIYASALRKKLSETEVYHYNAIQVIQKIRDQYIEMMANTHEEYDEKAGKEPNSKYQKEWDCKIAMKLEEYIQYSEKTIRIKTKFLPQD